MYHGPNPQGKLEVELVTPKPRHGVRDSQSVYAVKAFNASSTLHEFDNVAVGGGRSGSMRTTQQHTTTP